MYSENSNFAKVIVYERVKITGLTFSQTRRSSPTVTPLKATPGTQDERFSFPRFFLILTLMSPRISQLAHDVTAVWTGRFYVLGLIQ